jgi:endonuclease/exonuclease/phosphatase family metal-dependent hydrolase
VIRTLLLLLLLCLPAAGRAAELKIATWNLDWLTTRGAGDRALPRDVTPRRPQDFDRLRHYAAQLAADVVAIQEVDGRAAAEKLFPPERYSVHMSHDWVVQRVGLAIRRGLPYTIHPDVTAIAIEPDMHLRSGVDVTLDLPGAKLRLLAVHLKRGCQTTNRRRAATAACRELAEQQEPLRAWIADRAAAGEAFLVLGDFNRQMDGRDAFLAALRRAAPLTRATEGRASPCWGGEAFIDHILAGGPARDWMRPDTLRVLLYDETDAAWKDRLSDHCPVSVRVAVPDGAAPH